MRASRLRIVNGEPAHLSLALRHRGRPHDAAVATAPTGGQPALMVAPIQNFGSVPATIVAIDIEDQIAGLTLVDLPMLPIWIAAAARYSGILCTLLAWHEADPVDELERRRHERIVETQGNRNCFIDRPEFSVAIWGNACGVN
jgi:Endonuclease I